MPSPDIERPELDRLASLSTTLEPPWYLELVKRSQVDHDTPTWLKRAVSRARHLIGMACGMAYWIADVIFGRGSHGGEAHQWSSVVLAVHDEASNRTRMLADDLQADAYDVLLLGRNRGHWRRELAQTHSRQIVRPWSRHSAQRSFGKALSRLRVGLTAIDALNDELSVRDAAALAYRVFLGSASENWWSEFSGGGEKRPLVIYGHTGTFDTIALELAQQESGAATVHWCHGIATAGNFRSISDVVVMKCGYDCELYRRFGEYRHVVYFPATQPDLQRDRPGHGLLILSNWIHPMNPRYREFGPADEFRLLEMVTCASDHFGIPRGSIVWKPHPTFYSLRHGEQSEIVTRVLAKGMAMWPEPLTLPSPAEFEFVVTTPSTVNIDVLRSGKVPAIVRTEEAPSSDVTNAFPLVVTDENGLIRSLTSLREPKTEQKIFEQAWHAVGPGRTPSLAEIIELAEDLGVRQR